MLYVQYLCFGTECWVCLLLFALSFISYLEILSLFCVLGFGFTSDSCPCVSRGPEERQLGPPGSSEEGGGGSKRHPAESSVLRPAAPAHQLSAHTDYSWVYRVTWSPCSLLNYTTDLNEQPWTMCWWWYDGAFVTEGLDLSKMELTHSVATCLKFSGDLLLMQVVSVFLPSFLFNLYVWFWRLFLKNLIFYDTGCVLNVSVINSKDLSIPASRWCWAWEKFGHVMCIFFLYLIVEEGV